MKKFFTMKYIKLKMGDICQWLSSLLFHPNKIVMGAKRKHLNKASSTITLKKMYRLVFE